MNSDGSGQARVTDNAASDVEPTWSPDGGRIAFSRYLESGRESNIYVMNADGTAEVNLTTAPGLDFKPAWSPDGTPKICLLQRLWRR